MQLDLELNFYYNISLMKLNNEKIYLFIFLLKFIINLIKIKKNKLKN